MPDPLFVPPMLAVHGPVPASLRWWASEVKWDGMRVVVTVGEDGAVHAYSRTGADATARFPELQALDEMVLDAPLILDGEVVALGANGAPDFGRLQQRMMLRQAAQVQATMGKVAVTMMLFDVLRHRGQDTTGRTYHARRELLESFDLNHGPFRTPPAWEGDDGYRAGLEWTRQQGLEGLILKQLTSLYRPGERSRDWLKVKHRPTLDVVIGGWEASDRGDIRSLLVGTPEADGLRYIGNVGSGLSAAGRRQLAPLFAEAAADQSPFTENTPKPPPRVHWLLPLLTGEIEYAEITEAGHLRQPSWKGLRGIAAGE